MTPGERLEHALTRADGSSKEIERLEIEILSGDRFRWSIWADGRRVFSDTASADQLNGMLRCTGVLAGAALGIPPRLMIPESIDVAMLN